MMSPYCCARSENSKLLRIALKKIKYELDPLRAIELEEKTDSVHFLLFEASEFIEQEEYNDKEIKKLSML